MSKYVRSCTEHNIARIVFISITTIVIVLAAVSWIFYNIYKSIIPQGSECVTDFDCAIGGCSGQICTNISAARIIITDCLWKEEYRCLRLTSCGCIEGKCVWKSNDQYLNCMNQIIE